MTAEMSLLRPLETLRTKYYNVLSIFPPIVERTYYMYLRPRPHEYHLIEQDDRNLTKQSFVPIAEA